MSTQLSDGGFCPTNITSAHVKIVRREDINSERRRHEMIYSNASMESSLSEAQLKLTNVGLLPVFKVLGKLTSVRSRMIQTTGLMCDAPLSLCLGGREGRSDLPLLEGR